ncbi:elongation factor P [Calycomorphotria hydatis]|uniref:Elongation factor P n=1 Tax=Calycomorphotria hydatis TaxID=2528027 RepID=A0A517T7Y1_9PLAN|nr:elongation factor P [Calycomorphotria hydatis]QDT64488.1 Elongation factor P [Calycomorphotria hydatis]
MAIINTSDFRKGLKVEIDNEPYEILECNFVKPGKGQALYKTKLRNLLRGTILDRTYRSGDAGLPAADVQKTDGQYLYRDGDSYIFMDNTTFEQYQLPAEPLDDKMKFLMENATVDLLLYNGNVIDVTPPLQVVLEVTYAEPAAKGNTATNVTKNATVETGTEVQVPAFIVEGNKIKIETATGNYVERVSN